MRDPGLVRGVVREGIKAVRHAERRGRHRAGAGADALDLLPNGSTFVRGLSIGALVGAAIAGSTIWERWHRRRQGRDAAAVPDPDAGEAGGS